MVGHDPRVPLALELLRGQTHGIRKQVSGRIVELLSQPRTRVDGRIRQTVFKVPAGLAREVLRALQRSPPGVAAELAKLMATADRKKEHQNVGAWFLAALSDVTLEEIVDMIHSHFGPTVQALGRALAMSRFDEALAPLAARMPPK